jgi:hypothetical protein
MIKKFIFVLFLATIIISDANAQSTLALQEKCAEGAEKFVSDIQVRFLSQCHYNKKLDRCFVKVMYFEERRVWTALSDVFENAVIGFYFPETSEPKSITCFVENKKCNSLDEFEALIKPYMEE